MAAIPSNGLPGNLALIQSLLAAGMTSLDPELAGALIGHGGPLKVLYVTGDYYDINAVWQTNITSDVDVMYQLAEPAGGRFDGASSRTGP